MKRRHFLASLAGLPFAASLGFAEAGAVEEHPVASSHASGSGWRRFELTTSVLLPEGPGVAQLFLPLAQSAGDYQVAVDLGWQGSGTVERVRDARYGAPLLRTSWNAGDKASRQVECVQIIDVRERAAAPLLPLNEAERHFWTAPTNHVPADGIVLETAARITVGKDGQREQLRAIYDWVVDHTHRDPDVPGCGTGDFRRMLETAEPGGKCADINSLMVGLSRAAGFPAREVYGLRVAASNLYACLGRNGDVSKAQHCRAEVFLDEEGWFPVDPADVRKVVLEEKVILDSLEGRALRERMFGHWEMNWVGYNSATDIILPGGTRGKPDFSFLMYPCAFTEDGQAPCLDPARFRYEIHSRELTAA